MLRRSLLVAALLAPLAASAQTVTFSDAGPFGVNDCQSVNPAISLTWTVTTTVAIEASSTYRIVALRSGEACSIAAPVAGQIIKSGLVAHIGTLGQTAAATYPGYDGTSTDTLHLADLVAGANLSCTGSTNQSFTVCVQLLKADNTYVVSASGTLTLEREAPARPVSVTASAGDSALNVSWAAGTGSNTSASTYRAEAYPCADATDVVCNSPLAASDTTANKSVRLEGLTVGTRYRVVVYAVSAGGVDSLASDPAFGVPITVNDYWEQYKLDGGQEEGGCAGGPAGALSILAVAGLARLLRRRS